MRRRPAPRTRHALAASSPALAPRTLRRVAALLVAALLGALVLAGASPAAADSIDDRRRAAEQKAKENDRKRAEAEDALEGVSAGLAAVANALLATQNKIPEVQAQLDIANQQFDKAKREAAIIAGRLDAAKDEKVTVGQSIEQDSAKATQMRDAIGQMARQAYRGGGEVSSITVVLDAQSTEDFVEKYGMVSTALRTQAQVLEQLRESEATNKNSEARLVAVEGRITELKAEADQKLAEADAAQKAAAAARKQLDELLAEQQQQQAALESQKAAIAAELAAADAADKQIEAELQQIIAEQRARDSQNGGGGPVGPLPGAIFGNPTSVNPIYVTSEYGMRFHPILHYWRLHNGIDLRTYCKTPIYAGRDGKVLWASWKSGYGNQVMVDHGFINGHAVQSSYNHMTSFVVRAGQSVNRGQLLGYSGNTGTSAGCHLHFVVYIDGNTTNPRPYLGI